MSKGYFSWIINSIVHVKLEQTLSRNRTVRLMLSGKIEENLVIPIGSYAFKEQASNQSLVASVTELGFSVHRHVGKYRYPLVQCQYLIVNLFSLSSILLHKCHTIGLFINYFHLTY